MSDAEPAECERGDRHAVRVVVGVVGRGGHPRRRRFLVLRSRVVGMRVVVTFNLSLSQHDRRGWVLEASSVSPSAGISIHRVSPFSQVWIVGK